MAELRSPSGDQGGRPLDWAEFERVDARVGVVTRAEPFPEARKPAYKLWIDFGPPLGEKRSSARITERYAVADLVGRQVVCVVNFAPKRIGPFVSEVLVLGAYEGGREVILLRPDWPVTPGSPIG
jgi:tRNA-binding protein